jgi:S1-C subfamily serine protease
MSGLTLVSIDEQTMIEQVFADSPAERGDLQKGDLITAVNGKPTSEYTLFQVRMLLTQADRRVVLTVQRRGQLLDADLKLTDWQKVQPPE